ncbi:50S ribosomal protein L32 [Planctomycetales bacterium ZRK34]|nr:50S ribosomal protein L32 [Planctomycetales bacterium ZRK34]
MQPKQRTAKARKLKRRSHHALDATQSVVCPRCGSPRLPHAACDNCGFVRPGLSLKDSNEE